MRETTPQATMKAEGLHYHYDDFEAVRGVDLEARTGELLAVLGTNGAGKTTILEILQGLRPASAGTVSVLGLDPFEHRRELASRVGVMFQHSALPDELTPAELLATWRHLTGDPTHRLVPESLDLVDLQHRATVRIGRLSGGERRRLDLAVALSTHPDLLFLDEPTSALDPESRAGSWRVIRNLLRRGVTIVLTTHHLNEAEELADRVAILHQGRLEVSGTVEGLVTSRGSRIHCDIPSNPPVPADVFFGQLIVTPHRDELHLEIHTHQPSTDLRNLQDWAETQGIALRRLRVSEASLEEIFHEIVRPTAEGVPA